MVFVRFAVKVLGFFHSIMGNCCPCCGDEGYNDIGQPDPVSLSLGSLLMQIITLIFFFFTKFKPLNCSAVTSIIVVLAKLFAFLALFRYLWRIYKFRKRAKKANNLAIHLRILKDVSGAGC